MSSVAVDEPHRLHLAEWKKVDGGVVVGAYQAFCRCGWSQRWPTEDRLKALAAYDAHPDDAGEAER